jgi:hypothetical protein
LDEFRRITFKLIMLKQLWILSVFLPIFALPVSAQVFDNRSNEGTSLTFKCTPGTVCNNGTWQKTTTPPSTTCVPGTACINNNLPVCPRSNYGSTEEIRRAIEDIKSRTSRVLADLEIKFGENMRSLENRLAETEKPLIQAVNDAKSDAGLENTKAQIAAYYQTLRDRAAAILLNDTRSIAYLASQNSADYYASKRSIDAKYNRAISEINTAETTSLYQVVSKYNADSSARQKAASLQLQDFNAGKTSAILELQGNYTRDRASIVGNLNQQVEALNLELQQYCQR